jgi:hypothetical protein
MKQIFTLLIAGCICLSAKAQVVLNEIYGDPGNGNHEFFELYNNSTSGTPLSLDAYTVITYFETSPTSKGFYVFDLPNVMIASKGFFVASSAYPFNFQGNASSTLSNVSWNDLGFLAGNKGYMKKWTAGNLVPSIIDDNAGYDEEPVPALFNDFFNKQSGGGASFAVFIYQNGILINAFFAGTGGSEVIPAFITSMPALKVNGIDGSSFTANFSSYGTIAAEFAHQEGGIDNGYIRSSDGLCDSWTKSAAGVQHTPQTSNGSATGTEGSITIEASITKGETPSSFSTVSYQVESSSEDVFPLVLQLYIDNGSIPGELDATDTYLLSQTVTSTSETYNTNFLPYDQNILIAVKSSAGCYDQVMKVNNQNAILPVKLLSFQGSILNGRPLLQWTVADNETGSHYIVEKSHDAVHFSAAGYVLGSEKTGMETYRFKESKELETTVFYRVQIINKDQSISYSKVIRLVSKSDAGLGQIRLMQNPVESYLNFSYQSSSEGKSTITIYNMTGAKLYATDVLLNRGINTVTLNLGGRIYQGAYIVEVVNNQDRSIAKFIKK